MESILTILLSALFLATLLNIILKKFDLPTVIGYIVTGTAIAYIFQLHHLDNEVLIHVAEFGVVFLMFTIGLEFSINHLKRMRKEVFLFGLLQVFITGVIFISITHKIFGVELKTAIIIGFALALSSTAIVLKILNESGDIHAAYGRKALGILLFQDIAVIPILLMINIFTNTQNSLEELLLTTLVNVAIVLAILVIVGKYMINRFFIWITSTNSNEIFVASIILIVLASSYLAHFFGFAYSLGAFIAGMLIAETKFKHQVEADLIPFRDLLLGVFFVSIGMQIDLAIIWKYFFVVIFLLVAILIVKAIVIYSMLYFFSQKRTALKTAIAISQVGEFSLAIFALAQNSQLIEPIHNQILISTVVLSMILTPFILKNLKQIADFFSKEPELNLSSKVDIKYTGHIILCGYGALGKHVARILKEKELKYLILEHDIKLVKEGKDNNEPIYFANAAQKRVLENFNIKQTSSIILAISNEKKIRLICEAIEAFKVNINVVVKVSNFREYDALKDLKFCHLVNQNKVVAKLLVKKATSCKIGDNKNKKSR